MSKNTTPLFLHEIEYEDGFKSVLISNLNKEELEKKEKERKVNKSFKIPKAITPVLNAICGLDIIHNGIDYGFTEALQQFAIFCSKLKIDAEIDDIIAEETQPSD